MTLPLCAGLTKQRCIVAATAVLILLPCSFLLPSCGIVDTATAYFNTYYNARRVYDEAELEVLTALDARPGGRDYLIPCGIAAGTKAKFASVIEKCSKLLQYHPESSLMDASLLLIGKSYFYSDDDQKAERKFRELTSSYPESNLVPEANLFLARSLYRMRNKEEARAVAARLREEAEKAGDDGILSDACLLLAQMDKESNEFDSARGFYEQAAQHGETAERRSSAYLQAAEMLVQQKKYGEAEIAYTKASDASNNYVGEYRGTFGALRMQLRQGEYDPALRGLRRLRANSNNREYFGEIDLEIAHVLRDMGNLQDAMQQYTLVDTLYGKTEFAARSYYALGRLLEDSFLQYDSALVAYSRARNEFPAATITADAAARSDYLARYLFYLGDIRRCDSVAAFMLLPDSVRAAQHEADSLRALRPRYDSIKTQPPLPPIPLSSDTLEARLSLDKNEIAGLFYVTIGKPDSAERWYRKVVDEHPKSPYVPRAFFTLAQIYRLRGGEDSLKSDSLNRLVIARYPSTDFAAESRRLLGLPPVAVSRDSVWLLYEDVERMMLEGKDTAAVDSFRSLARDHPRSPAASKALYAAGYLYEQELNNPDSAAAVYEQLVIKYPTSPFAVRVQPKVQAIRDKRNAPPVVAPAPGQPGQGLPPGLVGPGHGQAPFHQAQQDSLKPPVIVTPRPAQQDSLKPPVVITPRPVQQDSLKPPVVVPPVSAPTDSVKVPADVPTHGGHRP